MTASLLHKGDDPRRCPYCLPLSPDGLAADAYFTWPTLARIHRYAMAHAEGRGALTEAQS